jgi:hypothetical protein
MKSSIASNTVLQQVTEAVRVLAQQRERVLSFDHLREKEHADLGVAGTNLNGGAGALVRLGGWHPHVTIARSGRERSTAWSSPVVSAT